MKIKFNKILRLGCSICNAEISYLIEASDKNVSLIECSGKINPSSEILARFNNQLYQETIKNNTPLEKLSSIEEIKNELKVKSIYYTYLTHVNSKDYITVLMSSSEENFSSPFTEKISLYFESLKETIETVYGIKEDDQLKNDWFKETAKNIQSVLYSSDVDGNRFNFVSDTAANEFGFTKEALKEISFSLIKKIHPDFRKEFGAFWNRLKSGQNAGMEYKLIGPDSKEFFVRHTGFPVFEDDKVVRIVGSITNITEEIKFRKRLEKSEERFRLLIETADDLIFTLNSYGYFVTVNSLGAKGLGYTPEEMTGKHFLEFVDESSKPDIAIAFQQILNKGELTRFNVKFVDKFENALTYEINARNIRSGNGTGGLIGIGREVSERIKNEEKLKELNSKLIEANRLISIEQDRAKQQISVLEELNRLKNEFISNVSHELRTPLASIVGFAETLSSEEDLPPDMQKEFSQVIYAEGKRLARLINDVLDFSKLENDKDSLEKSTFNIIELLKEIVEKWQTQMSRKELTFHVEIPDALVEVNADKERISKAIGNLLSNAVKFTNKGGRVSLLVRDFLKEVEIIISDTGIGIPKEELPRLFQKFNKVNRSGTQAPGAGFGLAAVKQIIDLHEGLIKVKSEVDKGSTFIIKLPKK